MHDGRAPEQHERAHAIGGVDARAHQPGLAAPGAHHARAHAVDCHHQRDPEDQTSKRSHQFTAGSFLASYLDGHLAITPSADTSSVVRPVSLPLHTTSASSFTASSPPPA